MSLENPYCVASSASLDTGGPVQWAADYANKCQLAEMNRRLAGSIVRYRHIDNQSEVLGTVLKVSADSVAMRGVKPDYTRLYVQVHLQSRLTDIAENEVNATWNARRHTWVRKQCIDTIAVVAPDTPNTPSPGRAPSVRVPNIQSLPLTNPNSRNIDLVHIPECFQTDLIFAKCVFHVADSILDTEPLLQENAHLRDENASLKKELSRSKQVACQARIEHNNAQAALLHPKHVADAPEDKEWEPEQTGKFGTCVACKMAKANHVVYPCMHVCLCGPCSDHITVCPMCRGESIQKCKPVFFPSSCGVTRPCF